MNRRASEETQKVRTIYAPSDLWSNVGKRVCRSFLFFRPSLNWPAAMKNFKAEFDYIEETRCPVLEATMELASAFLARLACALRCRDCLSEADGNMLTKAFQGVGEFEEIGDSFSSAILLKACLEMGRLRPAPRKGFHAITAFEDIRTVDELLSYPLEKPLPRRAEIDSMRLSPEQFGSLLQKMRTTPEYHFAIASKIADFEYHSAVAAVARRFPKLSDAIDFLQRTPNPTKDEQLFLQRYPEMCEQIR